MTWICWDKYELSTNALSHICLRLLNNRDHSTTFVYARCVGKNFPVFFYTRFEYPPKLLRKVILVLKLNCWFRGWWQAISVSARRRRHWGGTLGELGHASHSFTVEMKFKNSLRSLDWTWLPSSGSSTSPLNKDFSLSFFFGATFALLSGDIV